MLKIGSRIKISENYHWAKNAIGTISEPPEIIVELSDNWKDNVRTIQSLKGILHFYWIKFDEPQIDSADDGPYHEAEIDSAFLEQFEG